MKIPCFFLEKPSPQVDSDTETDAVTETDAADAEDADSEGETETEAVDSPESEDAKVDPAEKADAENEKDVALIQEILGHVWRRYPFGIPHFFCMEVQREWDVILKMGDEPQVVHPTNPGGLVVILMLPPV